MAPGVWVDTGRSGTRFVLRAFKFPDMSSKQPWSKLLLAHWWVRQTQTVRLSYPRLHRWLEQKDYVVASRKVKQPSRGPRCMFSAMCCRMSGFAQWKWEVIVAQKMAYLLLSSVNSEVQLMHMFMVHLHPIKGLRVGGPFFGETGQHGGWIILKI